MGGRLESTTGFLRIRERKEERGRNENKAVGSIVFVPAAGDGDERSPANFQINISMSAAKFEALLKVAISGRLPSKFFVHAGERVAGRETRGMGYAIRAGVRTKFWDNKRFRSLPVTNFSVILPITIPEAQESPAFEEDRAIAESLSSNDQVAELADEFAVFQGETKNALTAVVSVVAVIGVLLLFINLVLIIRSRTPMNELDFRNRTAVITGGAAGIGFAIAKRLAASGATLALWDRDAAALATASAALSGGASDRTRSTSPIPMPSRARPTPRRGPWAGSTYSSARPASPARTRRRGSIRSRRGGR